MTSAIICGIEVGKGQLKIPQPALDKILKLEFPSSIAVMRSRVAAMSYFQLYVPGLMSLLASFSGLSAQSGSLAGAIRRAGLDEELMRRQWAEATALFEDVCPLWAPEPGVQLHLTTDASQRGLGGVLWQEGSDGEQRIIAMVSRALTPAEKVRSPGALETLAVVYALRRLHRLVAHRHIVCHTDHSALVESDTASDIPKLQKRWLEVLRLDHNLTFRHIPGETNVIADAISRMYDSDDEASGGEDGDHHVARDAGVGNVVLRGAREPREIEAAIAAIVSDRRLRSASSPAAPRGEVEDRGRRGDARVDGAEDEPDSSDKESGAADDGGGTQRRPWVPPEVIDGTPVPPSGSTRHPYRYGDTRYEPCEEHRASIVGLAHGLFHNGIGATTSRVRDFGWWWERAGADVAEAVAKCTTCAAFRDGPTGTQAPGGYTFSETTPGAHLVVDLVTLRPTPGATGQGETTNVALVIVDVASRMLWCYPLRDKRAETVSRAMTDHMLREGVPWRVSSDRGAEFQGSVTQGAMADLGARFGHSIPFYPQSNGVAEAGVKKVVNAVRLLGERHPEGWVGMLPVYCYTINSRRSATHGLSAHEAYFARAVNLIVNARDAPTPAPTEDSTLPDRLAIARARVSAILDEGVERREASKAKRQRSNTRAERVFATGSWVRRRNPEIGTGQGDKLDARWLGPYEVISRNAAGNYILRDVGAREPIGPYAASHLRQDQPPLDHPSAFYTVDRIIQHRDTAQGREYLVHWEGFPANQRSWIKRPNFNDMRTVSRYERGLRGPAKPAGRGRGGGPRRGAPGARRGGRGRGRGRRGNGRGAHH
jgi:hypothetical protein